MSSQTHGRPMEEETTKPLHNITQTDPAVTESKHLHDEVLETIKKSRDLRKKVGELKPVAPVNEETKKTDP